MSGSRGPPQSNNRYTDYDYEYGSSKPARSKKPPFNSNQRRDFTKGLPGSSSLTHSMGASDDFMGGSSSGAGRRYGSSRGGGAYGSYGSSIYGNNSNSNNSSPGGAGGSGSGGGGNDRYGGYNKPWRSSSSGELKSMNTANNGGNSGGGSSGDNFRKDRYDSYSGGNINNSNPSSGRNSLSNSGSRPFGKRVNSYGGSSSLSAGGSPSTGTSSFGFGSGSGSGIGAGSSLGSGHEASANGSSSLLNSGAKRVSDTYYPSRGYSSLSQSGGKGVDRYSSKYRGGFKGKGKRYGDEDQRRDYYAYQHHQSQHSQSQQYHQGGRLKDEDRNYDRYGSSAYSKDDGYRKPYKREDEDEYSNVNESGTSVKRGEEKDSELSSKLEEADYHDRERSRSERQEDDENDEDDDVDVDNDDDEDDDDDEDNDNEEADESNRSLTIEPTSINISAGNGPNTDDTDTSVATPIEPATDVKIEKIPVSESKPKLFLQTPVDVSNEIMYEEGCIYPLNFMETEFKKLKEEFERKTKVEDTLETDKENESVGFKLPYITKKPISDFQDYPFYSQNIGAFVDHKLEKLTSQIKENNRIIQRKKISLWNSSALSWKKWQSKSNNMDQQLKVIHPPDDEMRREIDSIDIRVKNDDKGNENGNGGVSSGVTHDDLEQPGVGANSGSSQSNGAGGRRNRRHGDLVTTEAEFQEILQSLEKEQLEDPMVKAQHVSAKIPDFILDPVKRDCIKYMDSNNMVIDKQNWSKRVHTDFQDTFSFEEHELFCEGFCMMPKRFGAISRHMGRLRTAEECVLHYYLTKKAVNYKLMVNQFKKKANKRAAGGRRKSAKTRNVSHSNTPITTPSSTDPSGTNNNISSSTEDLGVVAAEVAAEIATVANSKLVSEELYTETGRRKRAAAPIFKESNEGSEPAKKKQSKKKEDNIVSSADTVNTLPVAVVANSSDPTKTEIVSAPITGLVNPEQVEIVAQPLVLDQPLRAADQIESIPASVVSAPVPSSSNEADASQEIPEESDKFSDSKDKKKAITSYWSITEANLFPSLLAEHGTKWTTIADILSTKTATMVRNYFQRNSEKHGWGDIVKVADARLEAKFAAVLGQDAPVGSAASTNTSPTVAPIISSPNPPPSIKIPVAATSSAYPQIYDTQVNGGLKIGTFQHSYSQPQQEQSFASVPSKKPSINSLLSSDSTYPKYKPYPDIFSSQPSQPQPLPPPVHSQPPLQQQHQSVPIPPVEAKASAPPPLPAKAQPPPQRSSIMSLLNSDSSPVKNPYIPMSQPSSSLKSLLNSPPNPSAQQEQFEQNQSQQHRTPSGNGLSTLLSAASSQPYTPTSK
ncbi:hypothetical protein CLIB1423_06S06282 [[Candida] railenensis]|uniref:SANT domain-containing protein n=1 Tax=[Candida] railenensis TaxID=45579 RepID=A0A9P0VY08_9ASCO|nr:hypothetical protein CLIB1423_06S06282 [[Candida] railenensis]